MRQQIPPTTKRAVNGILTINSDYDRVKGVMPMLTLIRKYSVKVIATFTAALAIGILCAPIMPAQAQSSDSLLALIAQYTHDILDRVNNLPAALTQLISMATSWADTNDPKGTSSTLGSLFSGLTAAEKMSSTAQTTLQSQLTNDFFQAGWNNAKPPYANDISYMTLLGTPPLSPDPRTAQGQTVNSPYNYLKNVAGVNITHAIPAGNWHGSTTNMMKYSTYLTAVTSIQTYNAFVLSQLYTDMQSSPDGKQPSLNSAQAALLDWANNPDNLLTQVASESLGLVMRQLLMYTSQNYVLMTQLLQTQKQALATQAMTNTLLLLSGQVAEGMMADRAAGSSPGL